ncbi:MAG: hypothetical protein J6P13_03820 [Kiritimatiellae bacterium]|nr:hypothetical protein [Kiritimatiellia bacterium]
MTRNRIQEKVWRFSTILIVLVVVAGGLLSAWPTFMRGRALRFQDARLAEQIEEKKREIAKLRDFQQRFRADAEFVEAIARQNSRVFPGELVFLFEE